MTRKRTTFAMYAVALGGLIAFLLLGFGFGCAKTTIPDTPAGNALQGWLAAFNDGDSAAYRAFVEKNWPSGVKLLAASRSFRNMTGGLELRKIEAASTPTKIVALVKERRSDKFGRLTLEVAAAEPHHIVSVGVRPLPRSRPRRAER